jgi:hypothetical protein
MHFLVYLYFSCILLKLICITTILFEVCFVLLFVKKKRHVERERIDILSTTLMIGNMLFTVRLNRISNCNLA